VGGHEGAYEGANKLLAETLHYLHLRPSARECQNLNWTLCRPAADHGPSGLAGVTDVRKAEAATRL
jgi:hypothetical protein